MPHSLKTLVLVSVAGLILPQAVLAIEPSVGTETKSNAQFDPHDRTCIQVPDKYRTAGPFTVQELEAESLRQWDEREWTEALAPSDLEWRKRRGLVELADKTYAAAADDFREVLRSRPQDRECALGLARALAGQGQTSSARIALDDWLRKSPGDGEASALRDALPR